jgi:hypothetical protein
MSFKFIHIVTNNRIFLGLNSVPLCIHRPHFLNHLSIGGHSGWFHSNFWILIQPINHECQFNRSRYSGNGVHPVHATHQWPQDCSHPTWDVLIHFTCLISGLGIADNVQLFLGTSDLIDPWCPWIVQSISTKDQMQVGSEKERFFGKKT